MEEINKVIVKQQPKLTGQIGNTLIYVDPDLENKSIDITENGMYTITANEEYDALGTVEINANVIPQSAAINVTSSELVVELMGSGTTPKYCLGNGNLSYAPWVTTNITKAIIHEGITEIGYGTFSQCRKLKEVVYPKSLHTIGENAFFSCVLLELKRIPDTVQYVGAGAFYNVNKTTQLSMKNVKQFGSKTSGSFNPVGECRTLKAVWFGSAIAEGGIQPNCFMNLYGSVKKLYFDLPRTIVEALNGYDILWFADGAEVICNDDEGWITQEEFDAIDWATYTG
jgi:hypothetical protein